MKAMVLERLHDLTRERNPLRLADLPVPEPAKGEILVKVTACGVCHTEIDEIEGRTPPSLFPIVPGHQIVGTVERPGMHSEKFSIGDRVGIGWISSSCGACSFCHGGDENLCEHFRATGRDRHGGYCQYTTVDETFAFPIPRELSDSEAAPLLCAGAIGYRSLRLSGLRDGLILGLIGFGASAHIVLHIVRYLYPKASVFVFARSPGERAFAGELGASWTGDFGEDPPAKIHCAIDTTPVWMPVVEGLKHLERGGRLVINAIRKEETDKKALLDLDYARHLWMEKEIKSVANVARRDIGEFLDLAAKAGIRPEVQEFPLEDANRALLELKERRIRGAKVLRIE